MSKKERFQIKFMCVIALSFMSLLCCAQQLPTDTLPGDPGALSVYAVQNMNFGAFAHGNNGGTVIISTDGTRSVTGDVIAINMGVPYVNAIFEIEAPAGSIISISNGPDATLTGSNGGTMTLRLGNSSPASPFNITMPPPYRTAVNIGGTLTVGNAMTAVPGNYTGTFYVTFNQE